MLVDINSEQNKTILFLKFQSSADHKGRKTGHELTYTRSNLFIQINLTKTITSKIIFSNNSVKLDEPNLIVGNLITFNSLLTL